MSLIGRVRAVTEMDVEVTLLNSETSESLRIHRDKVFSRGAMAALPQLSQLVYISDDLTRCDYLPQAFRRIPFQDFAGMGVVNQKKADYLSFDFTEVAEFQNVEPLRWMMFAVWHYVRVFPDYAEETRRRLTRLGVNSQLLDSFEELYQNNLEDSIAESGFWTRDALPIYSGLVSPAKQLCRSPDSQDLLAFAFNIYVKLQTDSEGRHVFTSGEPRLRKVAAYQKGQSVFVLLPRKDSGYLGDKQWHVEPVDDLVSYSKAEQETLHRSRLIASLAEFLLTFSQEVVKVETSALLRSERVASAVKSLFNQLTNPTAREALKAAGLLERMEGAKTSVLCCKCATRLRRLTLPCRHSLCTECLSGVINELKNPQGIFLPEWLSCPMCNSRSPVTPNVMKLGGDKLKCSFCGSVEKLAKCGGLYHCKQHIVRAIREGTCIHCNLSYDSELLEGARGTLYECLLCKRFIPLRESSASAELRCYCVYCQECANVIQGCSGICRPSRPNP